MLVLERQPIIFDNSQQLDYLKCSFCLNHNVKAKSGNITCPDCRAEFEIDDRLESILLIRISSGYR